MVIQHNILALNTTRQNNLVVKSKQKQMKRLSSGYKINCAADNAAGLSISEKMRKQVRGLTRAVENIEDGVSLCQVADGALTEVQEILQRMNELSIQSANGTNSQSDRLYIQDEVDALSTEIDRIAYTTYFNEHIFPLRGEKGSYTNVVSGGIGDTSSGTNIKPLNDDDYPGSNLQIVNASTISNYSSYVDANGKTHYQLGSGTFKIERINNCVFDVFGHTCIEDTKLKNVTINCGAGTVLSVKNVTVDNSANITPNGIGIGAAIQINGKGNLLNCYGDNEFNGGMDNYRVFTDSQGNVPYNIACAGINVGNGNELIINGTENSHLRARGYGTENYAVLYVSGGAPYIKAYAIGSNFHEDGGKITINGGNINAYGSTDDRAFYPANGGCIGGGYNASVIINGGVIEARGGLCCIGGGYTDGDSYDRSHSFVDVVINGGSIHAVSESSAAIGYQGTGRITINGGNVNAEGGYRGGAGIGGPCTYNSTPGGTINITGGTIAASSADGGAAIGTSDNWYGPFNGNGATINITGGTITAITEINSQQFPADAIGKGSKSVPVNVYVDGVLTDTSGTDDNKGNKVYTYSGSTNGGNDGVSGGSKEETIFNSVEGKVWIQMGADAREGMFINLVDATVKGIGLEGINVLTEENAGKAIGTVSAALRKVSKYRSTFGAQQNRLEHGILINENTIENTTAAESRIRDTDMAKEMVKFSIQNILDQIGQSMLAQSNQSNQGVLNLLT